MSDINYRRIVDTMAIAKGQASRLAALFNSRQLTGGILRYTAMKGYYNDNLENNYNGGKSGRYGYGGEDADPKMADTGTLIQDAIGDYYRVDPESTNAFRHTMSTGSFSLLGQQYREKALEHIERGHDKFNFDIETYREFDLNKSVGKEADIKEEADILKRGWHFTGEPFNVALGHNLEAIGDTIRNRYAIKRHTRYSFGYANANTYTNTNKVEPLPLLRYGDKIDELRPWDMINIKNVVSEVGLETYSLPYYSENTNRSARKFGYAPNNWYGVEKTTDGYKAKPRYVNDTTRKENSYHFYQEQEDGANPSFTPEGTYGASVQRIEETDKSNLLRKVNRLFQSGKIHSLVNRFHTEGGHEASETLSAIDSMGRLSRGRNLLRAGASNRNTGFDNPYCRVWTALHQYNTLKDTIRPSDGMSIREMQELLPPVLRPNGTERLSNNSVLQENGLVRIAPHKNGEIKKDMSKYMFSLENLAWKGFANEGNNSLSPEQTGPNGGRIMWFPPYNLKFTENVNVSWKDNEFIGRGEKIYTYANTERAGTLSFTLLIDHPSIVNLWDKNVGDGDKAAIDEDILRFFAGCGTGVTQVISEKPEKKEEIEDEDGEDTNPKLNPDNKYTDFWFLMFFPNNFSGDKYEKEPAAVISRIDTYEHENGVDPFTEMDPKYEKQKLQDRNYDNLSKYGLNTPTGIATYDGEIRRTLGIPQEANLYSYDDFKKLSSYFSGTTIFGYDSRQYEATIVMNGFASSHGYEEYNTRLAYNRANIMATLAGYLADEVSIDDILDGAYKVVEIADKKGEEDVNELMAKIARSAAIQVRVSLKPNAEPTPVEGEDKSAPDSTDTPSDNEEEATTPVKEVTIQNTHDAEDYSYQNEYLYFEEIDRNAPMVRKYIIDKVRFFDPAFHSMTPEGFNARLNFLHQCTRQGPTIGSHASNEKYFDKDGSMRKNVYNGMEGSVGETLSEAEKKAQLMTLYKSSAANLAFGRPPYCVLRIGDFFHTKICITSLSIDYDTGNGIQWDLNPEGAGVQPMYANVQMNFNFLGGQDIEGPINALQNALTYNYYANSSIYTTRDSYNNDILTKIGK